MVLTIQILCLLVCFANLILLLLDVLPKPSKDLVEEVEKKDKYEDYRDPVTGLYGVPAKERKRR